MSSFKIETTITTIDSEGKKNKESFSHSVNSLTDIQWKNISVCAGATKFVWNPTVWSGYEPSGFSVLAMVVDSDLDVEMTVNTGDANVEYNTNRIAPYSPFVLTTNAAYYNHAATSDAAFGGTLDVIDSIRVKAPTASAVNLTMVIGR